MPIRNGKDSVTDAAARVEELRVAFAFLSRLPLGGARETRVPALSDAVWAFPIVGAALGLIAAVVFGLGSAVGLSPWPAAVLAVAAQIVVTGALHEDGLGDVADGFGGGVTRERKLDIMRDSRSGTYGICAIALALMARVGALAALAAPGVVAVALIAAGALSRSLVVAVIYAMNPARSDGLGVQAGQPAYNVCLTALVLGALCAGPFVIYAPSAVILSILFAGAAAFAVAWLSSRQIGGHTGDVLGAVQQAAEIAVLLAAVIVLA